MFDKYIKGFIGEASEFLLQKIQDQTPEDTGNLQRNNVLLPITDNGTSIIGGIENTTPYGPYVEYGVNQRKYNYYKNGGRKRKDAPFYTGIGARMFTKAEFENKKDIMQMFEKHLNEGIRAFNSQKK